MRKYIIILFLCSSVCVCQAEAASISGRAVQNAPAENGMEQDSLADRPGKDISYLDAIRFEDRNIAKDGRTVCLSMDIILDSTKIRTQHTVSLTPVMVSADGRMEQPFGTVIVDGRTRHKVFLRRDRLDGTQPQRDSALAIIQRKNRTEQEYVYVSEIPYSSWMLDGSIRIDECVKGCADCGEGESRKVLEDPVLPKFIPQWKTGRIEPEPEPIKRREESRIARLQFKWDRADIIPWWKDNRAVLDTVTASIALVKEKDYVEITGIYVGGYASPEGTWEYNRKLSQRRVGSFMEYISGHNDIDAGLIQGEWYGEDWAGFREALEKSSFPKKDKVIEIIDTYTEDRNLCERMMLKAITRQEYVWLLRNIYPYLRHCTYRVEYMVKNFDLEEARRTIYDRPQDLNLNEIYKVAGSYDKDTEEYAYAMAVAAEYYPDSPAVLNDRALQALETGDAASAVGTLEGKVTAGDESLTGKEAELLNTLGVAYARAGQYDRARDAFEAASATGNDDATHNLTQLLNVLDQL